MAVARLGVMRLGTARLGYYRPAVTISIGGVAHPTGVRIQGASITDELDHAPNTASLRVSGFVPLVGQQVAISLGPGGGQQEFGGHILSVRQVYEGRPAQVAYDCSCIDYTWLLSRHTALKSYGAQSATTIILDLLASFSTGLTTANVTLGLPSIDGMVFTNEDLATALTRVMEACGGYWYVDYQKDVHAFISDSITAGTITQTAPRTMKGIIQTIDLSQVATRVTARGGGSNAAIDVPAGSDTIPVDDQSWYAASGGIVECGPQRIAYTGTATAFGSGSAVGGRAITAPAAPTAAVSGSAGNLTGPYHYRVTFIMGTGESTASVSSATVTAGSVAPAMPPSGIGAYTVTGSGAIPASAMVQYVITLVNAYGETVPGAPGPLIGPLGSGGPYAMSLASLPTGPSGTTGRNIYRSTNSGAYGLVLTIANNTATTATDSGTAGAAPPTSSGAGAASIQVSGIPLGPAGTSGRGLYRDGPVPGSFRRVSTIANNTSTTFLDNVAESSLGDEVPTVSTLPAAAGDTTVNVQELTPYPTGGWIISGSQLIRYTNKSGGSGPGQLTGIPASGLGSILSPLSFGAEAIPYPYLSGVTGIVYDINKGDAVNVVVTVEDVTAQAAMAGYVGIGDGVHEMFITDGRWSMRECTARASTELATRKNPNVSVTFTSHDPSLQSGRSVTIALTSPAISGTFKVQRVTLSDIGRSPLVFPLRAVEASDKRYSFEDLLRQIKGN